MFFATLSLNAWHRSKRPMGVRIGQQPGQLANLRHIGLHPEDTPIRIKTQRQKIGRRLQRALAEPIPVLNRSQGMEINNKHIQLR